MAEGCTFHYAWAGFCDLFFLFDGQTDARENSFLWRNCHENAFIGIRAKRTRTKTRPSTKRKIGIDLGPVVEKKVRHRARLTLSGKTITLKMRDSFILYLDVQGLNLENFKLSNF